MSTITDPLLRRWFDYLRTLSTIRLDPRLQARVGFSDIVQVTLWEAYRARHCIRHLGDDNQRRYLRRMYLNNLHDAIRRELAQNCNPYLEVPLQRSSRRIRLWLPAGDSSPSDRVERDERDERIAMALEELPPREGRAVLLQYFHQWKLTEIAEDMSCTVGAVAGLLRRGLDRLRERLGRMGDGP